jgi:membrane-associated phospholipid phosphatase
VTRWTRCLAAWTLAAAAGIAPAAAAEGHDLYRLRPAVDVPVTLAALAVAGIPYAVPDVITPRCPCDRAEVNRLDRFAIGHHDERAAVASDVTAGLAMVAPLVADALHLGLGPALRDDAAVFVETLSVNSALVVIAKVLTQRPLPLTYEGRPEYVGRPRGYRSFYSGHTSTVAAALTASAWTLRWRDGEQVWPWVVAGLATASVAVERVAGGRHFPSDVAVGAVAGFAVGTAVPWLHLRRARGAAVLVPSRTGLALAGRF